MERKVAIVTGGTGGIGTAICKKLAANYQVISCYFKDGQHEEAKRWQVNLKAEGFDVDILYADVAYFSDCERLVSLVIERFGHIDVLVNNAGITRDTSLKKMTQQQWQDVIDNNLTSVFNMTRNVLPAMLDKCFGRIINITSIVGVMGNAGQANYAASKAGLIGMTKSVAAEVASRGITANCIAPGFITTPMTDKLNDDQKNKMLGAIPAGAFGTPSDIASACVFLSSNESGYITGQTIHINGGMLMV